ncbi:hypothetical protein L6Q21_15820 [Sandaracinobacter sp. RS1-74]|uniref:hypothetical protein n=1 Tax=Sandaracinobacteroides sayramensis TaxID=2913411 RepID=UPI001EDC2065|nr:hypothetical protein [Sandaracinobacteroides sayramensis]MCG2842445.1 hypothetical protein [Sandaracinobacteroides sayramensis]
MPASTIDLAVADLGEARERWRSTHPGSRLAWHPIIEDDVVIHTGATILAG